MDAAWIFTITQYLLGSLLRTSIYLLLWPLSFLHWLASPFLYALRGLLALALLPLQLFIILEVHIFYDIALSFGDYLSDQARPFCTS